MPTVPRYEPETQAPRRMPTPYFATGGIPFLGPGQAPGARLAGDVLGMAVAAQEEARKEQERARLEADRIALTEAEGKLALLESQLMIQAQQKKGKDALGLIEAITPEWEKRVGEIESSLVHDNQRRLFRAEANRRRAILERGVFPHMAREIAAFDKENTDALLNAERSAATAAFSNPERVRLAVAKMADSLRSYAERNGLSEDFVKGASLKAAGDTVKSAVYMALRQGRLDLAEAYADEYKEAIDAESLQEISQAVQRRKLMTLASEATDAIFTPRRESLEEVLSEVRKIENLELRSLVEDLSRQRWRDITQAREEEENNAYEQAAKIIENTGGDLELVREDVWQKLSSQKRALLEKAAAALRKPQLNPDLRDSAITEFWTMSMEERAKITPGDLIAKWRPYLPEQDYQEIVKAVGAAKEAVAGRNREQYEAIVGPKDAAIQELQRLNLYPMEDKDATKDEKRRAAALLREIDLRRARAKAEGKPVPDVRTMARQIIYEQVQEPGTLFRGQRPRRLIDLLPGEPVLPPDDVKKAIEQVLKSRGKIPTDDLIRRLYGARLLDDMELFEQLINEAK